MNTICITTCIYIMLFNRLEEDPVLNYTEDSGLISLIPEDIQNEFFFANRGMDSGFSVRLRIITGSNDDPGTLVLPKDIYTLYPSIRITGSNTSTIFVQSAVEFDNAPVNNFTEVFRRVQISFADQAPRRYTD